MTNRRNVYKNKQIFINQKKLTEMKTKRFLVAMMAFAAVMFSACEKDNKAEDLPDNTLTYNESSYTFGDVEVFYYHPELTVLSAYTTDTMADGRHLLAVEGIHITPDMWNKTLDLTNVGGWSEGTLVELHFSGDITLSFSAYCNGDAYASGELDGVNYENESIFKSGTFKVTGKNDGTPITIILDGELKNGKQLKMKIVTPKYTVE